MKNPNSSDAFTNLFYFFHQFLSVSVIEKKKHIFLKQFFFLSLPVEKRKHNKYPLKDLVDLEFNISETTDNENPIKNFPFLCKSDIEVFYEHIHSISELDTQ